MIEFHECTTGLFLLTHPIELACWDASSSSRSPGWMCVVVIFTNHSHCFSSLLISTLPRAGTFKMYYFTTKVACGSSRWTFVHMFWRKIRLVSVIASIVLGPISSYYVPLPIWRPFRDPPPIIPTGSDLIWIAPPPDDPWVPVIPPADVAT